MIFQAVEARGYNLMLYFPMTKLWMAGLLLFVDHFALKNLSKKIVL